jgi:alkylation response protein AidB-like acyl-CoA dehydrogenase
MIDLQPSEDQEQIVRSVTEFLTNELPLERLRPTAQALLGEDHRKWGQIGALGYFSLGLAESLGGSGLELVDEVLVFREFGRFLLSPASLAVALGARVMALAGRPELASAILNAESSIGLAVPFEHQTRGPPLTGMFHLVDDRQSDWLMTWNKAGAALIPRRAFTAIEPVQCIDWTVSLTRARLDDYTPEYWVDSRRDDIPGRANLLTAAMLTGAAEASLHDSVEFVKTRHQFGQPLGAFQAVKHRCADMATRASAAWCLTLFATLLQQQADPQAAFQVAAAKMIATDAAIRNAAADIQNFGGMGFTGEQNPHLFLKRAHLLDRIGGDLAFTSRQFMTLPSSL